MGSLSKGHYTAHVNEGGRWFACDDAWVEAVSEEEVSQYALTGHPYILFYVRRAFSPARAQAVAEQQESTGRVGDESAGGA